MNKVLTAILLLCFICIQNISFAEELARSIPDQQSEDISIQNTEVLPYNFSSIKRIPIELSIIEEISTQNPPNEGDIIKFKARKNVFYKKKLLIKSGQIIPAKVETIITSGMNGFPAEIIIDHFQIPGIEQPQLISEYTKKGQNRCYWVYPLKWSLTLIPFVGSLTNLIMGGHAKIKTTDIITIYYYPQW